MAHRRNISDAKLKEREEVSDQEPGEDENARASEI